MITGFIQGGLGNILFQVAAGVALSKRLGVEYFLHKGQHYLPLQGRNINEYRDTLLKSIKFKDLSGVRLLPHKWYDTSYKEIPKTDNQLLIGYFQSEKYFEDCKESILDLFEVPDISLPEGSVAIHIRRGDYLKNPNYHPTQPVEYYKKALKQLGEYSHAYIISDSEVRDFLDIENSTVVTEGTDYDQFCLMANCDHNIIANSTFSWWAAYLNKKNNKVVAPKLWFGPTGPKDWIDIYCDGWKVI